MGFGMIGGDLFDIRRAYGSCFGISRGRKFDGRTLLDVV